MVEVALDVELEVCIKANVEINVGIVVAVSSVVFFFNLNIILVDSVFP